MEQSTFLDAAIRLANSVPYESPKSTEDTPAMLPYTTKI